MNRVLFDVHYANQRFAGNGRYTLELLAALRHLGADYGFEVLSYGPARVLGLEDEVIEADIVVNGGRLMRHVRAERSLSRLALTRSDVVHAQYAVPLRTGASRCLTIHDASFAVPDMPGYSPAKAIIYRWMAERADVVLTVSRFAQRELARRLGLRRNVRVVSNGVRMDDISPTDTERLLGRLGHVSRPLISFVGRMAARKRVPLAIDGFRRFSAAHGGLLVLAGPADDDIERIQSLVRGKTDVVWLGEISDAERRSLLGVSDAFMYLSEYEGYGLPVLEAMAAGVPTVIADTPALLEVAESTCVVVKPNSEAVAEGLALACFKRDRLATEVARTLATRRTWESTAHELFAIYREISTVAK